MRKLSSRELQRLGQGHNSKEKVYVRRQSCCMYVPFCNVMGYLVLALSGRARHPVVLTVPSGEKAHLMGTCDWWN